jgi:hypothetical protein
LFDFGHVSHTHRLEVGWVKGRGGGTQNVVKHFFGTEDFIIKVIQVNLFQYYDLRLIFPKWPYSKAQTITVL